MQAVAPKPVNLLIGSASEFTLDDIAAMGVRRVSVGGALARAAWGGFLARPVAWPKAAGSTVSRARRRATS